MNEVKRHEDMQIGFKAELALSHLGDIIATLEGNAKAKMLTDYRMETNFDAIMRSVAYLTALDDIRNRLREQILKKVKHEKEKLNEYANASQ